MARSTPWGTSQHSINHCRGFSTVSTASHGGMMVSPKAAEKYLSKAAIKRALIHESTGYLCYEEDCDILIVFFDAKEIQKKLFKGIPFFESKSQEEIDKHLIKSLTLYNLDYLKEMGIEPDKDIIKELKLKEKFQDNTDKKCPNTIINISGEYKSMIEGVYIVETANNEFNYVTKKSYEAMVNHPTNKIIKPLSSLKLVFDAPKLEDRVAPFIQHLLKETLKKIHDNNPLYLKEKNNPSYYGVKARLNGTLHTVRDNFITVYMSEEGISRKSALDYFNNVIFFSIYPSVHEELIGIDFFTNKK